MSTLKISDPCADSILDFIAGGVPYNEGGESGGNYNAVMGNAHATDDLSALDLDQIYLLMRKLLAEGRPSTAVGRYQFLKSTMVAAVGALKVPNSTKFTPAFQDRMCVELMSSSCRYTSWKAGVLTDQEFAHLLSTQWASLPDPENAGKSHYDGVGPNQASTSVSAVYAMLSRARAAAKPAGPLVSPMQGTSAPTPVLDALKALRTAVQATPDGAKQLQTAVGVQPVDGFIGKITGAALALYLSTVG